jgi:hypothetical protein
MVYINEHVDVNTDLLVVCVRSNSFQEISYAGKPQVVSRYSLKSMVVAYDDKQFHLFLASKFFIISVYLM